jgi:hypothetical protein
MTEIHPASRNQLITGRYTCPLSIDGYLIFNSVHSSSFIA